MKTTAKTTPAVGDLVPQAHGGALRHGGTNKGGPGRPRSEVQAELRGPLADDLIEVMRQIGTAAREVAVAVECPQCGHKHTVTCDDPPAGDADRLRAADIVLKYGTGTPSADGQRQTVILSLEPPPEYRDSDEP
ncbi:MAG: hypothetical protein ACYSUI_17685 [Planctomycetota bacterium]|jgi:hypothetical protein